VIRPATAADVDAMADVWLRAALTGYEGIFPPEAPVPTTAELTDAWRDELDRATVLVADDAADAGAGSLVGTVAVRDGWLRRLYVDPDRWGEGIGAALHDAAVGLGARQLWVLERNDRARRFYERRGWVCCGETKPVHEGVDVVDIRYRR
jgi:GNAT superfamily N-acetyltransferase